MTFTPLHRAAGVAPGPLTDAILDAAIDACAVETDDLDWKSALPPAKDLSTTEFPKDVAAMANSGGGVLVYGVREAAKAATQRADVGELSEVHERALRSAAVTAISPPVFGLTIHRLGEEGNRAVVVEVASSVDGPHLIYRKDYFGAPLRNDADTVWMRERQIEVMYRARFDERRHQTASLNALFDESSAGRDSDKRAWLIAVARPRNPRLRERLTRGEASKLLKNTAGLALMYADRQGVHPLEYVDRDNLRPGLRRWVAVNSATDEKEIWKEAWISLHHDGSVTLAAAVGGHRIGSIHSLEGGEVEAPSIESAIADFLAIVRKNAELTGYDEYDVCVGVEWSGATPLTILAREPGGSLYKGSSIPLHRFTPVRTTINAAASDFDYHWQVHDLAQDCVNQGGILNLLLIEPPERDD